MGNLKINVLLICDPLVTFVEVSQVIITLLKWHGGYLTGFSTVNPLWLQVHFVKFEDVRIPLLPF